MIASRAAGRPAAARRALRRPVTLLAPVLAGISALVFGGCGSSSAVATQNNGTQLTIYSSLPLSGPMASTSLAIVNGEKLALAQAGGEVGQFQVSYYSLNDARPVSAAADPAAITWNPGVTAADAKTAAQDKSTIAYLGDYNSGATAVSLPLTNAAGILQITPGSPYVGLTTSAFAGQDEPGRFYVTGKRTFGRVAPNDRIQGAAMATYMRRRGVHRLMVLSDSDPFEGALGQIVAANATRQGIAVAPPATVDVGSSSFVGVANQVQASGADAIFYSGGLQPGTAALWRQLYAADPHLMLLGSQALDQQSFTSKLGTSARNTYLTTPLLAVHLYPPTAQAFFRAYQQRFGTPAPAVALYGYEAMQEALAAIRGAGSRGNERAAVVNAYFALRARDSVLGRFSILPSGDTSLAYYGVDRVVQGRPSFAQKIVVASPAGA
jgi:branched-chain amino acid transport system substrate-binding protein